MCGGWRGCRTEAAEHKLQELAKEVGLAAAEEEARHKAEARRVQGNLWSGVEPGGEELTRGTVWIGRANPQVRWEGTRTEQGG